MAQSLRHALFAILLVCAPVRAQERRTDHNAHGWFNYFGDHPLGSSRWGVHIEGQWRRHDVVTQWQQMMLRPGINYAVNPKLMLTAGYAFIRSYQYGAYPAAARTNEHRIWEQALIRYKTGPVAWSTRLRFENRFLGTYNAQTAARGKRYENRLRMLQQLRLPLTRQLYLTAYDELWFYVKPYQSSSAFDQNRAYGALGINLDESWKLECGYMNQAVLQRSGSVLESNHTLMISIFSTARFGRR
jgi:hypothetical protein